MDSLHGAPAYADERVDVGDEQMTGLVGNFSSRSHLHECGTLGLGQHIDDEAPLPFAVTIPHAEVVNRGVWMTHMCYLVQFSDMGVVCTVRRRFSDFQRLAQDLDRLLSHSCTHILCATASPPASPRGLQKRSSALGLICPSVKRPSDLVVVPGSQASSECAPPAHEDRGDRHARQPLEGGPGGPSDGSQPFQAPLRFPSLLSRRCEHHRLRSPRSEADGDRALGARGPRDALLRAHASEARLWSRDDGLPACRRCVGKGSIVSALPPKRVFGNMDPLFVEDRRWELERFLHRLLLREEVFLLAPFWAFFEASHAAALMARFFVLTAPARRRSGACDVSVLFATQETLSGLRDLVCTALRDAREAARQREGGEAPEGGVERGFAAEGCERGSLAAALPLPRNLTSCTDAELFSADSAAAFFPSPFASRPLASLNEAHPPAHARETAPDDPGASGAASRGPAARRFDPELWRLCHPHFILRLLCMVSDGLYLPAFMQLQVVDLLSLLLALSRPLVLPLLMQARAFVLVFRLLEYAATSVHAEATRRLKRQASVRGAAGGRLQRLGRQGCWEGGSWRSLSPSSSFLASASSTSSRSQSPSEDGDAARRRRRDRAVDSPEEPPGTDAPSNSCPEGACLERSGERRTPKGKRRSRVLPRPAGGGGRAGCAERGRQAAGASGDHLRVLLDVADACMRLCITLVEVCPEEFLFFLTSCEGLLRLRDLLLLRKQSAPTPLGSRDSPEGGGRARGGSGPSEERRRRSRSSSSRSPRASAAPGGEASPTRGGGKDGDRRSRQKRSERAASGDTGREAEEEREGNLCQTLHGGVAQGDESDEELSSATSAGSSLGSDLSAEEDDSSPAPAALLAALHRRAKRQMLLCMVPLSPLSRVVTRDVVAAAVRIKRDELEHKSRGRRRRCISPASSASSGFEGPMPEAADASRRGGGRQSRRSRDAEGRESDFGAEMRLGCGHAGLPPPLDSHGDFELKRRGRHSAGLSPSSASSAPCSLAGAGCGESSGNTDTSSDAEISRKGSGPSGARAPRLRRPRPRRSRSPSFSLSFYETEETRKALKGRLHSFVALLLWTALPLVGVGRALTSPQSLGLEILSLLYTSRCATSARILCALLLASLLRSTRSYFLLQPQAPCRRLRGALVSPHWRGDRSLPPSQVPPAPPGARGASASAHLSPLSAPATLPQSVASSSSQSLCGVSSHPELSPAASAGATSALSASAEAALGACSAARPAAGAACGGWSQPAAREEKEKRGNAARAKQAAEAIGALPLLLLMRSLKKPAEAQLPSRGVSAALLHYLLQPGMSSRLLPLLSSSFSSPLLSPSTSPSESRLSSSGSESPSSRRRPHGQPPPCFDSAPGQGGPPSSRSSPASAVASPASGPARFSSPFSPEPSRGAETPEEVNADDQSGAREASAMEISFFVCWLLAVLATRANPLFHALKREERSLAEEEPATRPLVLSLEEQDAAVREEEASSGGGRGQSDDSNPVGACRASSLASPAEGQKASGLPVASSAPPSAPAGCFPGDPPPPACGRGQAGASSEGPRLPARVHALADAAERGNQRIRLSVEALLPVASVDGSRKFDFSGAQASLVPPVRLPSPSSSSSSRFSQRARRARRPSSLQPFMGSGLPFFSSLGRALSVCSSASASSPPTSTRKHPFSAHFGAAPSLRFDAAVSPSALSRAFLRSGLIPLLFRLSQQSPSVALQRLAALSLLWIPAWPWSAAVPAAGLPAAFTNGVGGRDLADAALGAGKPPGDARRQAAAPGEASKTARGASRRGRDSREGGGGRGDAAAQEESEQEEPRREETGPPAQSSDLHCSALPPGTLHLSAVSSPARGESSSTSPAASLEAQSPESAGAGAPSRELVILRGRLAVIQLLLQQVQEEGESQRGRLQREKALMQLRQKLVAARRSPLVSWGGGAPGGPRGREARGAAAWRQTSEGTHEPRRRLERPLSQDPARLRGDCRRGSLCGCARSASSLPALPQGGGATHEERRERQRQFSSLSLRDHPNEVGCPFACASPRDDLAVEWRRGKNGDEADAATRGDARTLASLHSQGEGEACGRDSLGRAEEAAGDSEHEARASRNTGKRERMNSAGARGGEDDMLAVLKKLRHLRRKRREMKRDAARATGFLTKTRVRLESLHLRASSLEHRLATQLASLFSSLLARDRHEQLLRAALLAKEAQEGEAKRAADEQSEAERRAHARLQEAAEKATALKRQATRTRNRWMEVEQLIAAAPQRRQKLEEQADFREQVLRHLREELSQKRNRLDRARLEYELKQQARRELQIDARQTEAALEVYTRALQRRQAALEAAGSLDASSAVSASSPACAAVLSPGDGGEEAGERGGGFSLAPFVRLLPPRLQSLPEVVDVLSRAEEESATSVPAAPLRFLRLLESLVAAEREALAAEGVARDSDNESGGEESDEDAESLPREALQLEEEVDRRAAEVANHERQLAQLRQAIAEQTDRETLLKKAEELQTHVRLCDAEVSRLVEEEKALRRVFFREKEENEKARRAFLAQAEERTRASLALAAHTRTHDAERRQMETLLRRAEHELRIAFLLLQHIEASLTQMKQERRRVETALREERRTRENLATQIATAMKCMRDLRAELAGVEGDDEVRQF
ncbi:hypothetical protein BESB_001770 [Besnoitia besnoiti]|uniref:PX domain-containing protein n=1 Tax=Besnoitia besnoiti TaxID=94643 RepID=A0A2A9MIM5_BESBE|nr:hypothetical protein BESB_001770 [Besnoitia besnoiti]PFH37835.1 hypothetical protein BESB_001770 [Besnoitia besnoiti]